MITEKNGKTVKMKECFEFLKLVAGFGKYQKKLQKKLYFVKYIISLWPKENRGEFVFYFKQNELVLSGGPKLHIYFKKKR